MSDHDGNYIPYRCSIQSSASTYTSTMYIANILIILVGCRLCHSFLGQFGLPKIISELIVGLVFGNTRYVLDRPVLRGFEVVEVVASSIYMFVLGLEMDPLSVFHPPGLEAKVAYSGIVSTCVVTAAAYYVYNRYEIRHPPEILAGFLITLAATSSPIVTRVATELKIGKSEVGRRAIRAGLLNDIVCCLMMTVLVYLSDADTLGEKRRVGTAMMKLGEKPLFIFSYLSLEMLVVLMVNKFVIGWVNDRNPVGKEMSGLDMSIVFVITQALCYSTYIFGRDTKMNAFLVGLFLSREGRVSNFITSKINYALTSFILPLYLSMAGLRATKADNSITYWRTLSCINIVASIGKLSGMLIAARCWVGLQWLEAVTLCVLLNIKGYFHIFMTFQTKKEGIMGQSSTLVMMCNVFGSIVAVPLIVRFVVKRARLNSGKLRHLGLQWHSPEKKLRIMVGLHSPHNVRAVTSLIKTMRGGGAAKGVVLYAVDMIQLTDKVDAALIYGDTVEGVTVTDLKILEKREQIGAALDNYVSYTEDGVDGLQVRRSMAVSTFANMHEDICCAAQDSLVSLIVLPFHRSQQMDGTMDAGIPGFRTVYRNVLQHAHCSVGILVDRSRLRWTPHCDVAVVFIGGVDDREALAYAGVAARNACVTVIRFVEDEELTAMARRYRVPMPARSAIEIQEDDAYFADFYREFVVGRAVGYVEKTVSSGAEMVRTLQAMEADYNLFVVGQGRNRESLLTAGMSEWAECPELGPIGDILAASNFSHSASVLVIRQRDRSKDATFLDNDFMDL